MGQTRSVKGAAPQRGPWWIAALALALMILGGLFAASPAPVVHAEPVDITEGELRWGVKTSWRNYVGLGQMSGGVTFEGENDADGAYVFPLVSGTYDSETTTTVLHFAGEIHWQAYLNYPHEGVWGLDTTFKDLTLVISPTEQVIRGTHVGYLLDDPGGELHVFEDAVLGKLDIGGGSTSFEGGVSEWTAIPTVAGNAIAFYPEGTPFDPTSVSYTGPGGVPDIGQDFDTPGGAGLAPSARWVSDEPSVSINDSGRRFYVSPGGRLIHVVEMTDVGGVVNDNPTLSITPLDATTLQPVGQQAQVALGTADPRSHTLRTSYDPDTESVFFVTEQDNTFEPDGVTVRVATWDAQTSSYDLSVVGQLRPLRDANGIVWNPISQELVAVNVISDSEGASTYVRNEISVFRREQGSWVKAIQAPLPAPSTGPWANANRNVSSPFRCGHRLYDDSCIGVLRDGSYLFAPGAALARVGTEDVRVPYPAMQVFFNETNQPVVTPVDGTEETTDPTNWGYSSVAPGVDGSLLLHNKGNVPISIARVDIVDGVATLIGAQYDAGQHGQTDFPYGFAARMASDPVRGWEWATGQYDPGGYGLNGFRDGNLVSRHVYAEIAAGWPIGVGPDGTLYVSVIDRDTGRYGIQRLEYLGERATFDQQPESVTVSLVSPEDSETVSFTSTVIGGAPAPSRLWQVKVSGESSFTDIPGETGPVLSVEAKAGMNGTRYRAVYTSVAGAIVSDVATLTVAAAPSILIQPEDAEVAEGGIVQFTVAPAGDPYPDIQWQRLDGETWVDVEGATEGFFTVENVTLELDGRQYRARVYNSAGEVISTAVTLTVTEGGGEPDPEPGGDATQTITTNIGETGSLSISVEGTQVSLPSPALNGAGDALESSGAINNVTVTDLRSSDPGWNVSGQVSDFTSSSSSFAGSSLGWTPELVSQGASQNVVAGAPVLPGGSLGTGAPLGTAGAGEGRGTAVLGAQLELSIPVTTEPGVYEATLTLTVI